MALSRRLAEQVDDLLAGGGASVTQEQVDEELNHHVGHLAALNTGRRAALAHLPDDLPRVIAAALRPAGGWPGRVRFVRMRGDLTTTRCLVRAS